MSALYLGLVHHPVLNKRGKQVTTSVTNIDIHDIARSCRTYEIREYLIITPIQAQKVIIQQILSHWEEDRSGFYNPHRQMALSRVSIVSSISLATTRITKKEGVSPKLVATGAKLQEKLTQVEELKKRIYIDKSPFLLLFGTGYGLCSDVIEGADYRLNPIVGRAKDGYNHLSVRSAVSIYLEKLCGELL